MKFHKENPTATDLARAIREVKWQKRGLNTAEVVLIHPHDVESIEYNSFKQFGYNPLSRGGPNPQFEGLRIIESTDIDQGTFEIF